MIGIGSIPWNFSSRSENPFEVARVGMRSVKTSTYSNTTQMAIQNYQLALIDVAAPEGSGMTVCRREWSLQNVWNYPKSRHPQTTHRCRLMTQSGHEDRARQSAS